MIALIGICPENIFIQTKKGELHCVNASYESGDRTDYAINISKI
jgi:hypothetical protein